MISFTLKNVAIKQLTIALRIFSFLILVAVFFCFFGSIECSSTIKILMAILALFIFAMLAGFLFVDHSKEKEGAGQYVFAAISCLIMLIAMKFSFTTFFYDDFMAKISEILPYLGGYTLIYALVVTIHLLSKRMKVGYPEGLIDEYKKASEQKDKEPKLFTNGSNTLPNISDLDKNITKNINIKSL